MKFLVLGANGMAGHMIANYIRQAGHDVFCGTRKPFKIFNNIIIDYQNTALLKDVLLSGGFDYIINCVGILNQAADECKSQAVYINSFLPHVIADTLKNSAARLIHLSTDCVFSGVCGNYTETHFPDGQTFYDRTKALGEVVDNKNLTFRNSIIGPDINAHGIGLFNWFMRQKQAVNGYSKTLWNGVTTVVLAKAVLAAAESKLTGLYHLTNNKPISKYELLKLFSKHFRGGAVCVNKVDGLVLNKTLKCTRSDFAFSVPGYEEMVIQMKQWVQDNRGLYPQYEGIT